MTEIVASPFEEFISACDLKRKENKAAFDIKYEFKKLTQIEQTRILESIKSYKIKAATSEDRLSIQDEFYRPLKSIIFDSTSLKGDKQESVTFETSLIRDNGEIEIEDLAGDQQKIKKEGDNYFVYSQEVYREATISVHDEGYIELEFTTSFDLEKDFLRALEVNYYLKCSRDNSLSTSELARFGMIREFNPKRFQNYDLSKQFKLFRGAFTGKSSFLHLKINELSPLQLEEFIQSIPEYIREAYFKLKDANGQTVLDKAKAGTEQARIIRAYLNQEIPSLENEPQNVHVAPVHNSVNESMVRLIQNLSSRNVKGSASDFELEVLEGARSVRLNHEKFRPFVDKQLKKLRQELKELNALSKENLYDQYITPDLVPFEIENLRENSAEKDKLIDYKKFQLKKALSLIEDVIEQGHTGDKYHFKVDVDNEYSNGMTVREMLAISYTASKDLEKLVRAGQNYQDLNEEDKTKCALEAKMKFFEGLYLIRRGYNLDHGTENRDKMTFEREAVDENVCEGGTVNRLGDALNGMHRDVEIRIFDVEQIKKRIQEISIDTINDHIDENKNDVNTAMQLREWKANGTMPKELQSLILKELKKTITPKHDLLEEFGKDFSYNELVGNIAQQAMESFKFPKEKIIVNTEKEVDILGYYMEHVYSLDEKGKTALNIDLEIRRNPEFIKELLDKDFNLSQIYVPRNPKMLHIASDYLRYFDDIPDKLITYIIEDLDSYKEVYMEMEASKQKILLKNSKPLIQALAVQDFGRIREFINLFPEEKRIEPGKAVITHFVENGYAGYVRHIIALFPEEKRVEFIDIAKQAITHFVKNGNTYEFIEIIRLFPEEKRIEFIDVAKAVITDLVENGKTYHVNNIIKLFPEEERKEFLDSAKQAITHFVKGRNTYDFIEIIRLFPEEKRKEFLDSAKQAITHFVENGYAGYVNNIIELFPEEKRVLAKQAITDFVKNGNACCVRDTIELFPEEKRIEFISLAKNAISVLINQGKAYDAFSIISLFPEEERIEFIDIAKAAVTDFVKKGNADIVSKIIALFPEEKSIELIGAAKAAITHFVENGDAYDAISIIKLFPEEEKIKFIDLAKAAITHFAENGYADKTDDTIQLFPKEERIELMKFAVIEFLENDCSEKEIDLVLKSASPELKHNIIKEVMDEQGFKPSFSKHLPWVEWGRGVMKELTKYMIDGMSNVEPQKTSSRKIPKPSGVGRS